MRCEVVRDAGVLPRHHAADQYEDAADHDERYKRLDSASTAAAYRGVRVEVEPLHATGAKRALECGFRGREFGSMVDRLSGGGHQTAICAAPGMLQF